MYPNGCKRCSRSKQRSFALPAAHFDRNNIPTIFWAAGGRGSARAGSIGEQKPAFPVALSSLCASRFLRIGQSFQRAGGLVCIRLPIKTKVGHKLAANDGAGNSPQIHT